MLLEFTVGNCKSFRDDVTLNLVATALREPALDEPPLVRLDKGIAVLPCAAVYGANASGKSNLAYAMALMRNLVRNSARTGQVADELQFVPYLLDESSAHEPTFVELVFLADGTRYRYGFEVTRSAVTGEWLHHVPQQREAMLFKRNGQEVTLNKKRFGEGAGLAAKTRSNALFLSVVAQFNGAIASRILEWFWRFRVVTGVDDNLLGVTGQMLQEGRNVPEIVELVRNLDAGIQGVRVRDPEVASDLPGKVARRFESGDVEAFELKTVHERRDDDGTSSGEVEFPIHDESAGTRKLVGLAGPLVETLRNGYVLVIDEVDARLHPLMTREIVRLFQSRTTNPSGAQLIVMSHDVNLLHEKLLRRDQIWFTEKHPHGHSALYSLAEFKVRNDASHGRDYIRGRFGAIPYPGGLSAALRTPPHEPAE